MQKIHKFFASKTHFQKFLGHFFLTLFPLACVAKNKLSVVFAELRQADANLVAVVVAAVDCVLVA